MAYCYTNLLITLFHLVLLCLYLLVGFMCFTMSMSQALKFLHVLSVRNQRRNIVVNDKWGLHVKKNMEAHYDDSLFVVCLGNLHIHMKHAPYAV